MQSPKCHSSLFICLFDMLWRSDTHSSVSCLARNVTEDEIVLRSDRRCLSSQSVPVCVLFGCRLKCVCVTYRAIRLSTHQQRTASLFAQHQRALSGSLRPL